MVASSKPQVQEKGAGRPALESEQQPPPGPGGEAAAAARRNGDGGSRDPRARLSAVAAPPVLGLPALPSQAASKTVKWRAVLVSVDRPLGAVSTQCQPSAAAAAAAAAAACDLEDGSSGEQEGGAVNLPAKVNACTVLGLSLSAGQGAVPARKRRRKTCLGGGKAGGGAGGEGQPPPPQRQRKQRQPHHHKVEQRQPQGVQGKQLKVKVAELPLNQKQLRTEEAEQGPAATAAAAADAGGSAWQPLPPAAAPPPPDTATPAAVQSLSQALDAQLAEMANSFLLSCQEQAAAVAGQVKRLEEQKEALLKSCQRLQQECERKEAEAAAVEAAAAAEAGQRQRESAEAQQREQDLKHQIATAQHQLLQCSPAVHNTTPAGIEAALARLQRDREDQEAQGRWSQVALEVCKQRLQQLRAKKGQLQTRVNEFTRLAEAARPLFDFLQRQQQSGVGGGHAGQQQQQQQQAPRARQT